ncbi:MAG TPA: ion transporter [Symbiobacteriaceae bacterium]|nr:ion transporter [Symbiobacteriaceae bacterium]
MKMDRVQLLMTILALLVIPLLIIEHQATDPTVLLVTWIANAVIWLAFVAEYVWGLMKAEQKWGFVRANWFDLAIILLSPPIYVPEALQGVRALRVLRLGRLGRALRLLRLVRVFAFMARAWRTSTRVMGKHSFGYILLTCVLFVLGSGAIFVAVEGEGYTLLDGIWWAVATLTTVGYGDIYPKTDAGRLVALVMIILGLGMMAALTANVAAAFVGEEKKEEESELLRRLEEISARLAALEDSVKQSVDNREKSGIQS